jgi:prepilin-type N-terminal cleavage/methylation domain-containing protein
MNTKYKQKGFTIIEVVLVLAIAGLIFLMVFIALPALQASQRDTARKNDASIVASWLTSYESNNQGKQPAGATDTTIFNSGASPAVNTYSLDVSTNTSTIVVVKKGSAPTTVPVNQIDVVVGYTCNTVAANGSVSLTAATNKSAVITRLEGSNNTGYCVAS